jgi:hypothetical protein
MDQIPATKKHAAEHRCERFAVGNSTVFRLRQRHRNLIDIVRPPMINRFCPDWFSLRIWEDDGGGQAGVS